MKLYLDAGHGGTDSGATGNGLLEKNVNLKIAKGIRDRLNRDYEGISIKMSRTGDTTKSLRARTDEANSWGADLFVSIHVNAFNGSAKGYEDFIFSGLSNSSSTSKKRDTLHNEIMKQIGKYNVTNRGKKKANFHVLRESRMSGILTENLFIDNVSDSKLLKNDNFINSVIIGHVNGIALIGGLKKKKSTTKSGTFYRVVTGSFNDRKNADKRVAELKKKGFESFIDVHKE